MSNPHLYTRDEQIHDVSAERPHLVILGAGASVAACPGGDATGRRLPVMLNLVDTLDLKKLLDGAGVAYRCRNFEEVYAQIAADSGLRELQNAIDERVRLYFAGMRLPDEPTIYDYIVLSLRPKDVVATFNWDPFLWQALERNHGHAPLPMYFFLHGCASVGWCDKDKKQSTVGRQCSICGEAYAPTRLLYPIVDKDYVSDPYIASQWRYLHASLSNAFLLTIFGYGATASDVAAIGLMSRAWGTPEKRCLEEIEMIDIKPAEQLANTWRRFIHSHNYTVSADYFRSILAMYPRRSVEAYRKSNLEASFRQENWVPRSKSFSELWDWMLLLIAAEHNADKT